MTYAIGYIRVSTDQQGADGLGMDAQRRAIATACEARSWPLRHVFADVQSGKDTGRPGLDESLRAVEAGPGGVLVVAKLDRLTRSLFDFAALMERSRSHGWALVALDLGVDTSTPAGEMMAGVMATFAQYERRLISSRTRDALAARAAQGHKLGPAFEAAPGLAERIWRMVRVQGMSATATARALNREGVPSPRGGRWYASSVQNAARAHHLRTLRV